MATYWKGHIVGSNKSKIIILDTFVVQQNILPYKYAIFGFAIDESSWNVKDWWVIFT